MKPLMKMISSVGIRMISLLVVILSHSIFSFFCYLLAKVQVFF